MFPSIGKYFNIKKPNIWRWPVRIVIPVNNNIIPPIFVIINVYFLKFLEKNKNLFIKIPEIINGIARPKE